MSIPCIDFDVHPMTRNGLKDLQPYLTTGWRQRLAMYSALPPARRPSPVTDTSKGANFARDTWAPDGSRPGSDPIFTAEQLLDAHNVAAAILTPLESLNAAKVTAIDDGIAFERALNDYFVDKWLPADQRYKLAIGVSPHDPLAAAEEIRRLAGVDRVVAVLLPLVDRMMGHRYYYPIYEAALEAGFPIISHIGSGEGDIQGAPTYAGGIAANFFQHRAMWPQVAWSNLISLVLEGTFVRYPDLKVIFAEDGFSWLPFVQWRMDMDWRALRDETPWLEKPPSHYVRKNIRLTTQPIDEPERPEQLLQILDMVHADETLLFSSDYPHWDNEFPERTLRAVPEPLRRRILYENALELMPNLSVPQLTSTAG